MQLWIVDLCFLPRSQFEVVNSKSVLIIYYLSSLSIPIPDADAGGWWRWRWSCGFAGGDGGGSGNDGSKDTVGDGGSGDDDVGDDVDDVGGDKLCCWQGPCLWLSSGAVWTPEQTVHCPGPPPHLSRDLALTVNTFQSCHFIHSSNGRAVLSGLWHTRNNHLFI